ncbi:DUF6797 domain-containing protein [Roseimaritima ulvae]|uniref:Laminin G domain protein n=1 Tax=Roseimaritima ulvae TaxID=980254 RepID=A0A5B9QWB9_9BACT|nr:DUF6797 domain-containing protein [Roseimaritima ulvae]QEG42282.1 Laminin G domain protein [Roseimaritima ulvae]
MPVRRFLRVLLCAALTACGVFAAARPTAAQSPSPLERQLLDEDPAALALQAARSGDAQRGAILFHQPWLSCTQCHRDTDDAPRLAPDLTVAAERRTDEHIVQSVLRPSHDIHPQFQLSSVVTVDGQLLTGLLVPQADDDDDADVQLRDPSNGRLTVLDRDDVELIKPQPQSAMPAALVGQLTSRTQFLDLIAYLIAIRDGGPDRARQLKPLASQIATRPLPEYEAHVDHARLIGQWDEKSFQRGRAIYQRLCINCHGDLTQPGSMPTSLRFASGQFKNGSDPHAMYQTLTRGFGAMVAQSWMVPRQKYDVIYYIRKHYLQEHNPTQWTPVNEAYLASLPAGDTLGPEPVESKPWAQMDYGPNLIATLEIGSDGSNFAHKGNAIRLDHGPGGVSQGSHWLVYDTDTMRVAAAWRKSNSSDERFIDYNGINFNGRHAIHPRIVGDVLFQNATGPGWASPDGEFTDRRVTGRDDRQYGPLPRDWAHYKGMYAHGADTIVHYTVGDANILEMPSLTSLAPAPASASPASQPPPATDVISRHLQLQPHAQPLVMQVAALDDGGSLQSLGETDSGQWSIVATGDNPTSASSTSDRFDGHTHWTVAAADSWNMHDQDYTAVVRFQTTHDGTLFAKTAPQAEWAKDGKALFIRGGRLVFDVGWVGAVQSKRRVDDGRWHTAAVMYDAASGEITLLIDGRHQATRVLKPKAKVSGHELRIGWTSQNFPSTPYFDGSIERVQFFQKRFDPSQWKALSAFELDAFDNSHALWADYRFNDAAAELHDRSEQGHDAVRHSGAESAISPQGLAVGLQGNTQGLQWHLQQGQLRLSIPPTNTARSFTIHHYPTDDAQHAILVAQQLPRSQGVDLLEKTQGGPRRWQQSITTTSRVTFDDGPFAVDELTYPRQNPWFCRMRLTGLDFFENDNGNSAAVCDWDGNVWRVEGLAALPQQPNSPQASVASSQDGATLQWTRIASGLFQPLGIKIIDGQVFVNCRDQICILRDRNGDGETDYYESFNNDHQVTEHFHEFAMGLQADAEGNLYYAKSARHALPAVVPHHGTLLKVSADGASTEILATGFRAANGVCLNPDGTFYVTDQEGHWNPKNRINWVRPGGFYGNMYGYHDVTDSSDEAMQPPLCWITNAFDRSPSELLWVDSERWGPLNGSLLNFSYGYGKAYIVPHENLGDITQGGMCELPIPQFPTGIHRGRFHPIDGQLYLCGMFAWAGTQQQDGGLYRLRYTGRPVVLPLKLTAHGTSLRLRFSAELDDAALRAEDFQISTWSLKRSASYGSKHYDTKTLTVASATLDSDNRTVTLQLPELEPTWCMEIRYRVPSSEGQHVEGVIHNTIHQL